MKTHRLNLVSPERRGAVLPLFALILPVLFIVSGLAINLAYMQLISTQMKVATDAAAHAGGRAMSIEQTTDAAYQYIQSTALLNDVGNDKLRVQLNEVDIQFGKSIRDDNGYGRYQFHPVPKSAVDAGIERATSVAVTPQMNIPLVFRAIPGVQGLFASRRSIATQIDRDIALVLDRSGSMLTYKDTEELEDALYDLYRWRLISWHEYRNARRGYYSPDIVDNLTGDVQEYVFDRYYHRYRTPRHSRWYYLDQAVTAFLNVLEATDQEEQVCLVTFSSSATLEMGLQKDYTPIRDEVATIFPNGATAIGRGLQTGLPPIISGSLARPFAAKTILVLTDGVNNVSPRPQDVVQDIVQGQNVTIHTVTFTPGADQGAMREVAEFGGGRHYHADDGEQLIEIFEEIANNLPTILTQ